MGTLFATAILPIVITATPVVPAPTSTIIVPYGLLSITPIPRAAARGSSIRVALPAPARRIQPKILRFSRFVTPAGTVATTFGLNILFLQILSYVSEQERINIRNRQRQGIELAKAAGKYKGRKPVEVDRFEFARLREEVEKGERTNKYVMDKLGLGYEDLRKINPDIMVLQGAGISNGRDVYNTIKLGAQATGSTSGILKAADPYAMVEEMLYNLRKAWDELHP